MNQHAASFFHKRSVQPFSYTILGWSIRYRCLVTNSTFLKDRQHPLINVLASNVTANRFNRLSRLIFYQCLKFNKNIRHIGFFLEKIDERLTREIISK